MLFTSEQVSCGHPDKICDQIADAVLTDCLRHDPESRVAVECLMKENIIVLAGEITSEHVPDTDALAHEVLQEDRCARSRKLCDRRLYYKPKPGYCAGRGRGRRG